MERRFAAIVAADVVDYMCQLETGLGPSERNGFPVDIRMPEATAEHFEPSQNRKKYRRIKGR